ncbi:MAG: M81 family metallopeptidase [Halobacteriales archaeon]|nr:M81 family metallopeptidase [Halobacteriales archaeon]
MADETVLVGGFSHETNTFAPTPTGRTDFQKRLERFGDEVPAELRGTNTGIGGVIEVADDEDVELVHTVAASATPGGYVTEAAYEFYTGTILEAAREHADTIDGVILPLHGAMVPEGMDDGEGPLISDVRAIVGDDVPIVVTLDLHGNITDEMVESADALVAYETYPHTDMGDTGATGMELLLETIRGETEPVMHIERPPVLAFTPTQNTREGPMAEVMAKARELEDHDAIRKVNVFPGFAAADIPEMGFSIPIVADGDKDAAEAVAREMAERIWEMREEFVKDYPTPTEGVARAKELAAELDADDGPIVLADVGDNPGGGGTGDTTPVLRALIDQEIADGGIAIMCDPAAVETCVEAGVGERVTVTIGGKTLDRFGEPIADVDGYVKAITDGQYVNTGPMGTGTSNNLGRAVRFQCGHEDGVDVILTENRLQPLDAEIWRHVGIQPERLDVLVVKSANHYRADYEPLSSHVIPIDSPGLAAMNPNHYNYDRIRRPKFPIDEMADTDYPEWN